MHSCSGVPPIGPLDVRSVPYICYGFYFLYTVESSTISASSLPLAGDVAKKMRGGGILQSGFGSSNPGMRTCDLIVQFLIVRSLDFFHRFPATLGFVALFRIAFHGPDRRTQFEKSCNGADRDIVIVRSC